MELDGYYQLLKKIDDMCGDINDNIRILKQMYESEEKSMLHNVTVKVEENKVLETYWTIRGNIKGNSLLIPYRELDHEPTPEEIAQFIHRNKVDYAFVEKDYRFENELPFC